MGLLLPMSLSRSHVCCETGERSYLVLGECCTWLNQMSFWKRRGKWNFNKKNPLKCAEETCHMEVLKGKMSFGKLIHCFGDKSGCSWIGFCKRIVRANYFSSLLSILLTPGVWVYHTPVVSFCGLKWGVLQFNSILTLPGVSIRFHKLRA